MGKTFRKLLLIMAAALFMTFVAPDNFAFAAPPAQVTGQSATAVSFNKVIIAWNSIQDASYYKVYRSTSSGFTPDAATLVAKIATSKYQDYMRSASTSYYYKISAVNAAGQEGPVSAQTAATTTAAATNVHPSLLYYNGELNEIRLRKGGGIWKTWYDTQKAAADQYLSDNVSGIDHKARGNRVLALCMAYMGETSNTGYFNKIKEYLNAMATDKSTITSLYGSDLYISYGAHAYGIAYDMVYNSLTSAEKTNIAQKLQLHSERLYDVIDSKSNNWIEVMAGGLATTGAAIKDYTAGGKSWGQLYMSKAKSNLERAMQSHVRGGGAFDEGESYCSYAYLWASEGMSALRAVGYADLFKDARYQNLLRYRTRNTMPLGNIPLYEDAKLSPTDSANWVAANLFEHSDPVYQKRLKWLYDKITYHNGVYKCFSPYFRYYGDVVASTIPGTSYVDSNGGLAFLRSGAEDEDLALSISSRPYTTGYVHQRPDEGSFEIWGYGAYLVHLPGYYSSQTEPYHSYARTAKALNLVSINGANPSATASEGFLYYLTGDSAEFVEADVNTPYGSAGRLRRTAIFVRPTATRKGYYVMVDQVTCSSSSATLDWYMHGLSENLTISGNNATWNVPSWIGGENVILQAHFVEPSVTLSSLNESFEEYTDGSDISKARQGRYVRARPSTAGSNRFMTVIYPRKASHSAPSFTDYASDNGVLIDSTDVAFTQDTNTSKTVSSVTSNAIIAMARKNGTALDFYLVKHGTQLSYNSNTIGYTSNNNVDMVINGLSGSIWVKTENTSLTIKHPQVTSAYKVKVDGTQVAATATAGSISFSIAATGAHTIEIVP